MARNIIIIQPGVLEESSDDGITHSLHILLFVLVLILASKLVLFYPLHGLVALVDDDFLLLADFGLVQLLILHGRLEIQAVGLQAHLAFDSLGFCFIVLLKLL